MGQRILKINFGSITLGGAYGARVTNSFEVCSLQRDDYENYTTALSAAIPCRLLEVSEKPAALLIRTLVM